jgi:predicted ATPase
MIVRDLGPLVVETAAGSVQMSGKPALVVGLVLASDGRSASVDTVLDTVWEGQPREKSAKSLDTLIWRMRAWLDADTPKSDQSVLRKHDGLLSLQLDAEQIDSEVFADHARRVIQLLFDGDAEHAIMFADKAMRLRRGEFLKGLPENATIWQRREQLEEIGSGLVESRWSALLKTGQAQLVMQEIGTAIAESPLRERNWELRMAAGLALGRPMEVLEDFRRVRQLLREELGIEPGPRLAALQREALAGAANATGVSRATSRPDRLPRADAFFVGRSEVLDELEEARRTSRLVTLVGAGGIGKTRLAIRSAEASDPARLRLVRFIDLTTIAPATDAELFPQAVAGIMGLRPSMDSAIDQIVEIVDRQPTLVILDNCEHVSAAIAHFVTELTDLTRSVDVLATSRRPIGVGGEVVVEVPPLTDSEARALLIHRARSAGAPASLADDADAINEIIEAVGNLPLGIELVASRSRTFALNDLADSLANRPDQIVARDDAANPRHRSLGSAISWGYELLSAPAQSLFRSLGVFRGLFSTEDAGAISPGNTGSGIRELVSELVDHSLVAATRSESGNQLSWFRMLPPIRQFALQELETAGETKAVRRLLADWLATQLLARPRFASAETNGWNDTVERSWPTMRNVLGEVLADDTIGGDIAAGVAQFGAMRNRTAEAVATLETAAVLPGSPRTRLLRRGALISLQTYRQREAEAVTSEAAPAIAREILDFAAGGPSDGALNDLLIGLAAACRYAGSYRHMLSIVSQAIPHLSACDDKIACITAARILDIANATDADPSIASAAVTNLLTTQKECADAGSYLGLFYCARGAVMADTRGLNGGSLSLATLQRLLDYVHALVAWGSHDLIDAVEILATILTRLGDYVGAAEALGAANAERIEAASPHAASTSWHDENISLVVAQLSREEFAKHYDIGRKDGARILDRVTSVGLLAAPSPGVV